MAEGFKHTHIYRPVGIDQFDPKTHPGSRPIAPGSPVKKHPGQFGKGKLAFVHIEDENGNHQQVFKRSIIPKSAAMSSPSDAHSVSFKDGDDEIDAWNQIFQDRRGR